MADKHHGFKLAGSEDDADQRNAGDDAQQYAEDGGEIALPQHEGADLLLVVAENLQRRVVAYALGKVHQAHVVADDEREAQGYAGEDGEGGGGRVQQGHAVEKLILDVLDLLDLVHLVYAVQAGFVRAPQQQGVDLKAALAQSVPGALAHEEALAGVCLRVAPDLDFERIGLAHKADLRRVARHDARDFGELPADERALRGQGQDGLLCAEAVDGLFVLQDREQAGAACAAAT